MQKDDERYSVVERTYREMHTKQTVAFVRGMVSQAQLLIKLRLRAHILFQRLLVGWVGVTQLRLRRLISHLSFHSFVRGRNGVT